MGLTSTSTGINAIDSCMSIEKTTPNDKIIALAGNPNVGKSTVFVVSVIWYKYSLNGSLR